MSIILSQFCTGVVVCIATALFLVLPHIVTSQSEVCSDPKLSGIIEATKQESQLIVVEDILKEIAPDLHSLISTDASGDASTHLNTAYTRLAERFEVKATKAGFTNFIEALTAISVSEAEACSFGGVSGVSSSTVADLVKAFDKEFSLPDRDLDRLRSLFGRLLCIDSGGGHMRTYASMMWRGKRQAPGCPPEDCTCPPGGLSSVVCSCQFFRCLDPDDHLKPIFGFSPKLSQCLAFVIDTTSSMSAEIATARRIILEFLRSEEEIGMLGCYLLVPFNDHGSPASSVGPILSANAVFLDELQAFYDAVNALSAVGGGDAPEYALDGMFKGLTYQAMFPDSNGNTFLFDIMSPGSQMIVITDAPSKRPEIKDKVIQNAVLREVCIHFFLSGNPVSDGVYPDVASGTSGTLISNFADWQLAQFVAEYSNNPCVYSTPGVRSKRQVVPPTPSPSSCQTFTVSTLAINLKLSSRVKIDSFGSIRLRIADPTGVNHDRNLGPTKGTLVDIYTEGLPPPGRWSVCTSAGTLKAISATIQNSLDLTIRYKGSSGDILDSPPPACSRGSIVAITTKKNIRSPKLRLIGKNGFTVDFPVSCSGAVLVSYPGIIFPAGRFTYMFEGIDEAGIAFEHNTGKEVFFGSGEGHSLRYAGEANVEVSESATKTLAFVLQNGELYDVRYSFSVSSSFSAIFSATVNPPSALIHAGAAVTVPVNVQLTIDTVPDKSSHKFVLYARDGCKVLSASAKVIVSRCGLDCQNGGKCVTVNYRGIELKRCQCPPGFSGTRCQIGGGGEPVMPVGQQAQRQQNSQVYNQQQLQWKTPMGGERGQRQNYQVYNFNNSSGRGGNSLGLAI